MKAEVLQGEGEKELDHEQEMAMAGKELREGCVPAGLAELGVKTMIPEEERINLS